MDSILLLILVLLYTFQSFFCKLYTTACKVEKTATPVFNALFGGVIGLVTLGIYGFRFQPSAVTWIFGLVNAVLLFVYNSALIGASKRGSYAFLNICMLFGGILVPMFVSLIQWGDTFSLMQILAILLMLAAFVVINCKGISFKGSQGMYYLFCVLLFLSNGAFGAVMDGQQRMLAGEERGEMIAISYVGTAVLSLLYIAVLEKKEFVPSFKVGTKALLFGLGSGAVAVAAVNLMMYLLTKIPSTILYTIDNGGVMVASALFAAIFLKEKIEKQQALGYVLALVSIVMLSL